MAGNGQFRRLRLLSKTLKCRILGPKSAESGSKMNLKTAGVGVSGIWADFVIHQPAQFGTGYGIAKRSQRRLRAVF